MVLKTKEEWKGVEERREGIGGERKGGRGGKGDRTHYRVTSSDIADVSMLVRLQHNIA